MRRLALLTIALCGLLAAPAPAHEGNPNYESLVTSIVGADGVTAEVLNGDDRLLVINKSGKTVTIDGYDDEPYARIKPDGTVEVNQNSPATWLNTERDGEVAVPANASKDAEPDWKVEGRNGRFEFHDHRAHWMNDGNPPIVKDESKRTKVFDWKVPIEVDEQPAEITGVLWWRGTGGGPPAAAFVALGVLALLGAALVVVVRKRRRDGDGPGGDAPATAPKQTAEAW